MLSSVKIIVKAACLFVVLFITASCSNDSGTSPEIIETETSPTENPSLDAIKEDAVEDPKVDQEGLQSPPPGESGKDNLSETRNDGEPPIPSATPLPPSGMGTGSMVPGTDDYYLGVPDYSDPYYYPSSPYPYSFDYYPESLAPGQAGSDLVKVTLTGTGTQNQLFELPCQTGDSSSSNSTDECLRDYTGHYALSIYSPLVSNATLIIDEAGGISISSSSFYDLEILESSLDSVGNIELNGNVVGVTLIAKAQIANNGELTGSFEIENFALGSGDFSGKRVSPYSNSYELTSEIDELIPLNFEVDNTGSITSQIVVIEDGIPQVIALNTRIDTDGTFTGSAENYALTGQITLPSGAIEIALTQITKNVSYQLQGEITQQQTLFPGKYLVQINANLTEPSYIDVDDEGNIQWALRYKRLDEIHELNLFTQLEEQSFYGEFDDQHTVNGHQSGLNIYGDIITDDGSQYFSAERIFPLHGNYTIQMNTSSNTEDRSLNLMIEPNGSITMVIDRSDPELPLRIDATTDNEGYFIRAKEDYVVWGDIDLTGAIKGYLIIEEQQWAFQGKLDSPDGSHNTPVVDASKSIKAEYALTMVSDFQFFGSDTITVYNNNTLTLNLLGGITELEGTLKDDGTFVLLPSIDELGISVTGRIKEDNTLSGTLAFDTELELSYFPEKSDFTGGLLSPYRGDHEIIIDKEQLTSLSFSVDRLGKLTWLLGDSSSGEPNLNSYETQIDDQGEFSLSTQDAQISGRISDTGLFVGELTMGSSINATFYQLPELLPGIFRFENSSLIDSEQSHIEIDTSGRAHWSIALIDKDDIHILETVSTIDELGDTVADFDGSPVFTASISSNRLYGKGEYGLSNATLSGYRDNPNAGKYYVQTKENEVSPSYINIDKDGSLKWSFRNFEEDPPWLSPAHTVIRADGHFYSHQGDNIFWGTIDSENKTISGFIITENIATSFNAVPLSPSRGQYNINDEYHLEHDASINIDPSGLLTVQLTTDITVINFEVQIDESGNFEFVHESATPITGSVNEQGELTILYTVEQQNFELSANKIISEYAGSYQIKDSDLPIPFGVEIIVDEDNYITWDFGGMLTLESTVSDDGYFQLSDYFMLPIIIEGQFVEGNLIEGTIDISELGMPAEEFTAELIMEEE